MLIRAQRGTAKPRQTMGVQLHSLYNEPTNAVEMRRGWRPFTGAVRLEVLIAFPPRTSLVRTEVCIMHLAVLLQVCGEIKQGAVTTLLLVANECVSANGRRALNTCH